MVWNDVQKTEAIDMHGVPADRVSAAVRALAVPEANGRDHAAGVKEEEEGAAPEAG